MARAWFVMVAVGTVSAAVFLDGCSSAVDTIPGSTESASTTSTGSGGATSGGGGGASASSTASATTTSTTTAVTSGTGGMNICDVAVAHLDACGAMVSGNTGDCTGQAACVAECINEASCADIVSGAYLMCVQHC
jgi:hypothetical protein